MCGIEIKRDIETTWGNDPVTEEVAVPIVEERIERLERNVCGDITGSGRHGRVRRLIDSRASPVGRASIGYQGRVVMTEYDIDRQSGR